MLSPAPRQNGFTLIELVVVLLLVAILLRLAVPAFGAMVKNSQVRTVAEALQNSLRLAQNEGVRRNRQVGFVLTTSAPAVGVTPAASGRYWYVQVLPLLAAETVDASYFVQGGAFGSVESGVVVSGALANATAASMICFNSLGRVVSNAATGIGGGSCTASSQTRFDVTLAGATRPLRVTVASGGQVRMCDPAKTLSQATPDGC